MEKTNYNRFLQTLRETKGINNSLNELLKYDFIYNSNKIEGSNFTIEDLQILFEKNIVQGTHWSYVNILDTKSQTFLCCTSS